MDVPPPEYDRMKAVMHSVEAPDALRARIAAERDRTLIRRMVVKRMKLTGVMAGAAAALGVSVALLAPSGSSSPSALDAAALATRPAVAAAPAVDPARPHLLKAAIGGIPFPRWEERFPWKPAGQRTDDLDGRATLTVFYDSDGPKPVRLGYTIIDGEPLPWPDGARVVERNGVSVWLVRREGRVMAFWRARGHSCVISAPDSVPEARMVALATSDVYLS